MTLQATVPLEFQFSQGSLQDYVTCPRRFELRYLLRAAWPAVEAEPVAEQERRLAAGQTFHRLVQQHQVGIPAERLARFAAVDADLERWWQNYAAYRPWESVAGRHFPEVGLSAALAGHRLVAKYDLVVVSPEGEAVIFDWKTSEKRTERRRLEAALQTRVYRYVLVRAGAALNNGRAFAPERVTMVYWFAQYPASPERFAYDAAQYAADEAYLTRLIAEATARLPGDFPLAADERVCRYCLYRSLCDRGQRAGALEAWEDAPEADDGLDFELDFDQIGEIAF